MRPLYFPLNVVSAGGAKAADVIVDIGQNTRYPNRTNIIEDDLNNDGLLDAKDIDLDGDGIADDLGGISPRAVDQVNDAITTDNRASLNGVNENRVFKQDCTNTSCVIPGDGLDPSGADVELYQLQGDEFKQALANGSEQSLLDEVIRHGDPSGDVKEQLARNVFERNGATHLDSKYTNNPNGPNSVTDNSVHGLDLVFEDPNTGFIVVVESKPFNNGAFNMNKATSTLSPQMSDAYIYEQVARMRDTNISSVVETADKIYDALQTGTIRKIVSGVDTATESFVMVPLN